MGVCSSCAFLIHKWVENFPRFPHGKDPAARAPGVVCSRKPHLNMEIKQRMSTRFAWLLGVVALVAMGVLVACGTTYNSTSDGLVLVGSQGSAAIQSFSFSLGTGHMSGIDNPTSSTSGDTCLLPGIPSSIVLDPAGAYAYAIISAADACNTDTLTTINGILAFKVNSDGKLTIVGQVVPDPNPVALAMDSAGKFLFVAEGGGVNSYAISGGTLTPVESSFTLAPTLQTPNFVALAATPTVLPKNGITGRTRFVPMWGIIRRPRNICTRLIPSTTRLLNLE